MTDQSLDESTHTISWVSYILHLIVAVSAVIPGAQMGPALLIVALIIDLVKKRRCPRLGGHAFQLPHPHRDLGGFAVFADLAALVFLCLSGLAGLGGHFHLVFVPHCAGHGAPERPAARHQRMTLQLRF